jgi:putative membrane protein
MVNSGFRISKSGIHNSEFKMQQANIALAKRLNVIAWIVTVAVLFLVGLMRQVKIPVGVDLSFLPPFHATLNGLTALVLIVALYYIKQKKVEQHRKAIYVALGLSALFLLSYVAYHFTTPETLYGDLNGDKMLNEEEVLAAGSWRTIYLVLLLSHIALAAVIFPFILFTFIRAYTGQFDRHRKMARWVFPVWLYVAITGPVVYLMLLPYY